jgi:hypothetical protein
MNIYVAYPETRREPGVRAAWVDRRYFSNLAGVNADLIELRRFDCRHDASAKLARDPGGVSQSMTGGAETANQQVFRTVCGDRPAQ